MTTSRFLNFISYNIASSELVIGVHDASLLIKYLKASRLQSSVKLNTDPEIITIHELKELGIGYVELFLRDIKKIAVEAYGEESWIGFVTKLCEAAKVEQGVHLADVTLFRNNFLKFLSVRFKDSLYIINDLLDVRSLASFQTVAFGNVPKVNGERDFSLVRPYFNYMWNKRRDEHYPPGRKRQLSLSTQKPAEELKLNYNESYFASHETSERRLLLHSTITGDINAPVMKNLTEENLLYALFARGLYTKSLFEIAKQYKQLHLLTAWWQKFIVPFYQLTSGEFYLNKANPNGYTILDQAFWFYQTDLIPKLYIAGANPTHGKAAFCAALRDYDADLKLLLEKKADVNQYAGAGGTALSVASECGHINAISVLLSKGADPNATTRQGDVALLRAAWTGSSACVRKLLEAKADYKAVNIFKETALLWAVQNDDRQSVKALLARQAEEKWDVESNPLLMASRGETTPLHLALILQHEIIADSLLQAAANNTNVLRKVLLHKNSMRDSTLSLAVKFPTLSMLKQILTLAVSHNMQIKAPGIEGFNYDDIEVLLNLDNTKNDLDILNLLEKISDASTLKESIVQLKKQAQSAYCEKLMHELTTPPSHHSVVIAGFGEFKAEAVGTVHSSSMGLSKPF